MSSSLPLKYNSKYLKPLKQPAAKHSCKNALSLTVSGFLKVRLNLLQLPWENLKLTVFVAVFAGIAAADIVDNTWLFKKLKILARRHVNITCEDLYLA
jgi:hypothetical protein